ncbi:MAG TPA: putative Fe-S cluster assembly protein SufT [Terracidiphilus sp.]|nr:putative Fe-S cluster assembly protein SufT [Terracidiphilus sp.]
MADLIELKRDCEAIAIPSGLRQTLPSGTPVRIVQSRGGDYTVSTERHAMFRIDGADADALGLSPRQPAELSPREGPLTEEMVWSVLRTVYDPELPVNVVDLGLIYSCAIAPRPEGGKSIAVRMAMTSPGCGMSNVLKSDVERKLSQLPEVEEARVEVVFDPPWSPDRMTEEARLQLGFDLDTGPRLTQISGF